MDIRERYAHLPLEQQLAAEKYFSGDDIDPNFIELEEI